MNCSCAQNIYNVHSIHTYQCIGTPFTIFDTFQCAWLNAPPPWVQFKLLNSNSKTSVYNLDFLLFCFVSLHTLCVPYRTYIQYTYIDSTIVIRCALTKAIGPRPMPHEACLTLLTYFNFSFRSISFHFHSSSRCHLSCSRRRHRFFVKPYVKKLSFFFVLHILKMNANRWKTYGITMGQNRA